MIIIPGLRGFSFTVGSAEKNPRRVTFMRFHLRETAFVSFKVKVEGEGEQRKKASTVHLESSPSPLPAKPLTKRDQAIADIANGDYAAAELIIREMLESKPNGAMALNLKAALEMKQGKFAEAERTLDQAVSSNPRDPSAYYNLALLLLQKDAGNKSSAKRYYETGRAMGGAEDPQLEALLK